MDYILRLLQKYHCEYDEKHKIFYIKKDISVKEFIFIKYLLANNKNILDKIEDIRVETLLEKRETYERRF